MGLLVVMALVVGILSNTSLPMEFMPEADNPQVTVTVLGPGQDAHSIEANVTRPIEAATSAVKGKTNMKDACSRRFDRSYTADTGGCTGHL